MLSGKGGITVNGLRYGFKQTPVINENVHCLTVYLALELLGILDVNEEPAIGVHRVVPRALPVPLGY
jgi:hypothetical protein